MFIFKRATLALALGIAACSFGAASAQEELYDRYGRPIVGGRIQQSPNYVPQQQPYYAPQPQYYQQQPAYDPYAPQRRQSRYQQGNACATQYGTCDLPGPMFVGKSCRCTIPGVGRAPGTAVVE